MFELTQINPNQFLRGWLYTDWQNKPTEKRFFKYEILDPKNRWLSDLGGNLWAKNSDITIKSNYRLNWQVDSHIELQNGKQYIITNVIADSNDVNPQSMRFLKYNPNTSYILSLKEYINGIN